MDIPWSIQRKDETLLHSHQNEYTADCPSKKYLTPYLSLRANLLSGIQKGHGNQLHMSRTTLK